MKTVSSHLYRSHAITIIRRPSNPDLPGYYSYQIDGRGDMRANYTTALSAIDAAEAAVDALVEDGPPPAPLPGRIGIWGDA